MKNKYFDIYKDILLKVTEEGRKQTELIIPEGVKTINGSAFYGMKI